MAKVVWTEPALNDLQGIIEYIAKDSVVYAERFGMRVFRPRAYFNSPPSWAAWSPNSMINPSGNLSMGPTE